MIASEVQLCSTCGHPIKEKDDGIYDFYDCHQRRFAKDVEVSQVSFNPRLFQVVEEVEEREGGI